MTSRPTVSKIRDVMTPTPATVGPDRDVRELIDLFERGGYNALPVVDDRGALLGIVSKLDILRLLRPNPLREVPELRHLGRERAADIMRPGVVTLEPDDPVVAAVDLMLESGLRSLPVVERPKGGGPRLVGLVSQGDLLRALLGPP